MNHPDPQIYLITGRNHFLGRIFLFPNIILCFLSFPNLSLEYLSIKMAELLSGSTLVFQDGTKMLAEEHLKDKIVCLYFSAGWCGPCHRFTPILKKFYEDIKAEGIQNFEVVFLSWDESAEEQEEYFRDVHGQWARLEHKDPKNKDLGDKFNVQGIPSLKLVKPNGNEVIGECVRQLHVPTDHYCDICRDSVGDVWFKCQTCEDYDLCRKCKTHLVLNAEHQFKEISKADITEKKASEILAKWMEKYEEMD